MKKLFPIIIFLISVWYIYSSSDPLCEGENVSKRNICHDQTQENSGFFCCYYKSTYNGDTATGCTELTKSQKENIKKTIEDLESKGVDIKSLDCKTSFIELGLFSLIFLVL
jgi:hypothetical protein